MHTLIVIAHPDSDSLTHHLAQALADAAGSDGRTVEVADLAAEGFDPRFTLQDRAAYHAGAGYPDDVRDEQARLGRTDQLVLVFPIWWWSMPALLKGWIDRVFANGWAFGYDAATDDADEIGKGRLRWLTIHLVPIASGSAAGFARHGYDAALRTLVEHGVIDYCGAQRGMTEYVWRSENTAPDELGTRIDEIADELRTRLAVATRPGARILSSPDL